MDEFKDFFVEFQDYLAPKLDVYEQAIYLYIARHTIAAGKREEIIGFKSARKKMAFGVGKAGTSPSEGDNSYRNVVAACRQCNNRKNSTNAEDFLRVLYREGILSAEELKGRLSHLERLQAGELKPH